MVKLDTKYYSGPARKITYKVDTGADGYLLPLRDLQRVQPGIDKNTLAHMINPNMKPEAYNGTEIEQFVQVYLYLSSCSKTKKCRFYMVDTPTALLGLQ